MPDVRLIDANALRKNLSSRYMNELYPDWCTLPELTKMRIEMLAKEFRFALDHAPSVEAMTVVRCRECVLRGSDYCPMCHDEYTYDEDDGGDYYTVDNTDDDGFCHKGKREV